MVGDRKRRLDQPRRAHAGYAYYTNRAGVLYCIDSKIELFAKDGTTMVFAAGGEEKLLAENVRWTAAGNGGPGNFGAEIQDGFAATPSGFVGRTGERLFEIGTF